ERLAEAEHDARYGPELRQVVVDQAHDLGAQALEIREVLRIDDAELLAEHAIAHLDRGPGGEVVRVPTGQAALTETEAVGVEVDAVERHLLQVLEQLALVEGAAAEHLAELPAAVEVKGRARGTLAHLIPHLIPHLVAPGASGAIRRRSQSRMTGSAVRSAGGASRHQARARTWARPRSRTTPASSARSSRPSASRVPSGRPTIRSSSAWASRRASQRAGNSTPRVRSAAARARSSSSGGAGDSTPAAISSAASYPSSIASSSGRGVSAASSGSRIVRNRASAVCRAARAALAPPHPTASARCSRCTPKRVASVK